MYRCMHADGGERWSPLIMMMLLACDNRHNRVEACHVWGRRRSIGRAEAGSDCRKESADCERHDVLDQDAASFLFSYSSAATAPTENVWCSNFGG